MCGGKSISGPCPNCEGEASTGVQDEVVVT